MGTKNNPGEFDCYASADPDEPMFVILGRDVVGSAVVRFWIQLRSAMGKTSTAKLDEARSCADAMDEWARRLDLREFLGLLKPASGRGDFSESAAWLREHRGDYTGRWVALLGGSLIDVDESRIALQSRIAERGDISELLVVFVESLNAMHCRADETECRGESYCACQCDKCKTAWAAGGPGGTDLEKSKVQP